MHIVSLSLDPHILNPESVVASRVRRYGEVATSYTIVVPANSDCEVILAPNVKVYGLAGSKPRQLFKIYKQIVRCIKLGQCDIISSQDTYYLALIGYIAARRYHKGLEVQVLGVEKLTWFRKQIGRFTIQHAGSIRILSKRLWRLMETQFAAPTERMRMVPIYVDVSSLGLGEPLDNPEFVSKANEFKNTYRNHFNFLTVSRLVPIKNIPMQLLALQHVVASHKEALLHIVGDGILEHELQTLVRDLGLTPHVIFHGHKTGAELSAFFKGSDTFILSSDAEGWGMVIVEAALAQLPVIMTDVGCAGEVIVDNESGFVVPVGDVPALIHAMETLLSDDDLRIAFRTTALKSVNTLPSFEELLEHYKMSWQQAYNNSY